MKRTALRIIRVKRGLTQKALAEKSGVDQGNISRLEAGKIEQPAFDTVVKLADALKCDPREIEFRAVS